MSVVPYVNFHAHRDAVAGEVIPFSAGVHPWFIEPARAEEQLHDVFETITRQLQAMPDKSLESMTSWQPLVGECGLDRLRPVEMNCQLDVFRQQLLFAEEHRLAVVIHCVRSFDLLWGLYKEIQPRSQWIIHGLQASPSIVEGLITRKIAGSFGRAILREESSAARALAGWPEELPFFLETDDATLPIDEVYATAAALRGVSIEQLKRQQWNATDQLLTTTK